MRLSTQQAIEQLLQGNVVALPTETVYGLAAPFHHIKAIEKIFQLKGRPLNNPLIMHLADLSQLGDFVIDWPEGLTALAHTFWPGPLTVVLPVDKQHVPSIVRAGLPTVAFRIPNHPLTQEILAKTGPLVMPSANLSGRPSATSYLHVEEDFGLEFPVVDGGPCQHGVESTIVLARKGEWHLLRYGAISIGQLGQVLHQPIEVSVHKRGDNGAPLCPGQLYRHYAPKAKLRLSPKEPPLEGCIIGFSDRTYPEGCLTFLWGDSHHPEEVSEKLYAILRDLDRQGIQSAWVDMRFPREGLWKTIHDRLAKAAGL